MTSYLSSSPFGEEQVRVLSVASSAGLHCWGCPFTSLEDW